MATVIASGYYSDDTCNPSVSVYREEHVLEAKRSPSCSSTS